MRYQSYLISEGRSKQIGEDETIKLLEKNCKKAMKASYKGSPIYRGLESSVDFAYIDPKKGSPRYSRNTANYYTLINDNSPAWKKYPKRSESIICSTDKNYADGYGSTTYEVFPYDGAKLGVASERDYWFSFENIGGLGHLSGFNDELEKLFKQVDIPLSDDSFKKIQTAFNMFDLTFARDKESYRELQEDYRVMYGYDDFWDFMKHIQEMLHPDNNSFELQRIGESLPESSEIWTDSKSIMIRHDWSDEIIDELI